jgi:hypothetical protein
MNDIVQCLFNGGYIEEEEALELSSIMTALPYNEVDLLKLLVALKIQELNA